MQWRTAPPDTNPQNGNELNVCDALRFSFAYIYTRAQPHIQCAPSTTHLFIRALRSAFATKISKKLMSSRRASRIYVAVWIVNVRVLFCVCVCVQYTYTNPMLHLCHFGKVLWLPATKNASLNAYLRTERYAVLF